jgi:hypothetical protein
MPSCSCGNTLVFPPRRRASSCRANSADRPTAMRDVAAASRRGLPPGRKRRNTSAFPARLHFAGNLRTPRQKPPTMTRRALNLNMPNGVQLERFEGMCVDYGITDLSQVFCESVPEVKFVKRKMSSMATPGGTIPPKRESRHLQSPERRQFHP